MADQHPITPPPELVKQWLEDSPEKYAGSIAGHIATQAANWGADTELEACCEWLDKGFGDAGNFPATLRAARRPKPPSLKERALQAWAAVEAGTDDQTAMAVIRRALEQLDD